MVKIKSSHKSDFSSSENSFFLQTCAACSELPSDINTPHLMYSASLTPSYSADWVKAIPAALEGIKILMHGN